jgi:DNA-binding winged helix-turn-helix (wHTH) protein
MRYVFGDLELDDATFELRRDGELVPIRPQALDVLLHLLRARDRVVAREELLEVVWAGTIVSSTALAQAIIAARRAIGDDAEPPTMIQTIRSRGYRFIAPVTEKADVAPVSKPAEAELVGREEPLAALEGMLAAARDGRGGIALVTGEPGVGKTRLVSTLAARAAPALVASARCHDEPAAPPLWPWANVMRELAPKDPELAALAPAADAQAQFRLFDKVGRFVRELARDRPLVIVLDDMQWADDESLALTKFVAKSIATSAVLLVVVYRSGAANAALAARTMGALAREDPSRTIVLRGLTREAVARLAKKEGRALDEHALARIYEKTEGNALFVMQLLHGMRGGVPEGSGATSAMLSTDVMRDAIALHIGELSPECARVLTIAAVLGRVFTIAALAGTTGIPGATLLPLLDEAIAARIVARSSSKPGEHRFVHALVRDVLYRRLAVAERVRLHAAAGDAILAHTPSPEGDALDAVATHFAEAAAGGDVARAVTWCVRAANRSGSPEEALEHLERAARAVEGAGGAAPDAVASLDGELGVIAKRSPALAARVEATRKRLRA